MLTDLWRHRAFITSLVRRDFQIPTARAAWGSAWLVIQPTAQILIFTVVFAGVLRAKLPGATDSFSYGFYVCSGFSGHGFKLGPAVGVMIADLVTGASEPEFDWRLFRAARYDEDAPVRGEYEYSIVG